MLINEKHLSLADAQTRKYLQEEMDKFFANQDVDQAEVYWREKAPSLDSMKGD